MLIKNSIPYLNLNLKPLIFKKLIIFGIAKHNKEENKKNTNRMKSFFKIKSDLSITKKMRL